MKNKINWFPGHMKRALSLIKENLKRTNIIIEVLDARAPFSSKNLLIEQLTKEKAKIILLNKSDLAKKKELKKWADYYHKTLKNNVMISSIYQKEAKKKIIDEIKKIANTKKIRNYTEKIKALIIGVPNVGKSSIINLLIKRKSASISNKPGHTKNIQIVKVSQDINMFDMPGILWHDIKNQEIAKKLAILNMIKNEIIDNTELALYLINIMDSENKKNLFKKYSIKNKDNLDILEDFAKKRNFILKNKELDLDRASKALIKEFRNGKFGKIILDNIKNFEFK